VPDLTLDTWAALSHKAAIAGTDTSHYGPQPWNWIGNDHKRRLTAYSILEAYRRNVARWYVQASSAEARDMRREYGDPDLLMRQVASSVLGRGYRIAVDGADDEVGEDGEAASGPGTTRQKELAEWSDNEQVERKLLRNEHQALSLGDSILWLAYSAKKKRVIVHVVDPGFYFPVYPGDSDCEDYPDKVHLAWQFEQWDQRTQKDITYVRRVTFELAESTPYSVPYQDDPATQRCLMTDATWTLDDLDYDLRNQGPEDFKPQKAVFRQNDEGVTLDQLDLGIDFIPVMHLPNFDGQPWGQSIFTSVSHIIDDLQMADTDSAEAADVAGGPPIVIAGADGSGLDLYGPKTVVSVPTGGQASVLDTSKGLDSLENHVDRLFRRLTVNARIPREILGIVGAAEVPSGTALALAFNPYKVMIGELRLSRKFKYRLLFKMVQRLMIVQNRWAAPVQDAVIEFGAPLPEDVAGVVALVKELAAADRPIISRVTGLAWLADVGLEIDDPTEEMDRVHEEDFDAARLIHDATDSVEMAAEHLGIELPEETREERVARETTEAQAEIAKDQQATQIAADEKQAATVAKNTPKQGAGTGTRNPGATSGSKSGSRNR